MKVFTSVNDPEIPRLLIAGSVGIIRTDTLYGLIARASDETAVSRIYDLKDRSQHKSPIVLVGGTSDLFDPISSQIAALLDSVWPGPVSVIIPSTAAPMWIRRDNHSVAYRQPNDTSLLSLLELTGPLVAPSANPEGEPPAMNISEAQSYFGDAVDFYVDGGQVIDASPSRLLLVHTDGTSERLR